MYNKIKSLRPFFKGALKSKTIAANVSIFLFTILGVYLFPALVPFLNNISMALAAVVNIYLRTITIEGLVNKGEK